MDIKKHLHNYFNKRKLSINYHNIEMGGCILSKNIDKIITSKIFKPSLEEVDRIIKTSINIKDQLKTEGLEVLTEEELENIDSILIDNTLSIDNLKSCKKIANYCVSIGYRLHQKHSNSLFLPLAGDFNLVELIVIGMLLLLISKIYMILT